MGTTPTYAWPYPELTDPPDGPAQLKALATAIETTVKVLAGQPTVQRGQVTGGPTNSGGVTIAVTFPRAFTAAPSVATNIMSGAGASTLFASRAIGVTATAFSFYVLITQSGTTSTWSAILHWIAVADDPIIRATQRSASDVEAEEGWHFATLTCRNELCPRNGEPVPGVLIPDDPIAWGWSARCGECAQPITDIT